MGAVNLRNPLISAPEAEQSVVSPFLLRRRPNRRSPAFAAVFGSPLSGSPIPGSHADVTILLPGNGPQSPGAPTNTNGTARSPSSSSRSANAGAAGTTATNTTAIKRRILNIIALSFESRTSSLESTNRQRRGEWLDRSRSEEHTSELQSRFDLVCRLLLEKKKKINKKNKFIYENYLDPQKYRNNIILIFFHLLMN